MSDKPSSDDLLAAAGYLMRSAADCCGLALVAANPGPAVEQAERLSRVAAWLQKQASGDSGIRVSGFNGG